MNKTKGMNIGMNTKRTIDWSCKHDVLLVNDDGTFSPMDEPYFRSVEIAPNTWRILSAGDYSYLVAGDKEAVAIDTGYGAGNIREYMQTLTDKPVKNVFNTHDHFDHTANNGYFEKAYMAPETIPLATIPFQSFEGIDFIQDYERVPVEEGFVYELGERTLEIFKIPDHAEGSIALLDRKGRLLFTGDEFFPQDRGKTLNVSLKTFYGYLVKLQAHRNEFDRLCTGSCVMDASVLDRYYACAKYILDGHEGVPLEMEAPRKPKQHKKVEVPKEYQGRIIYDRMKPHPGDGGTRPVMRPRVRMRVMFYDGIRIVYDAAMMDE